MSRIGELADDGKLLCRDPALEGDVVDLPIAVDVGGEPVGERIHTLRPDPVETTREFVGTLTELAAGVQVCEDKLDGRDPELGMRIDRDTPSVVLHRDRTVAVDRDGDERAMAGEMLIDRIVEDFENGVVQTALGRGIADIHSRALPHGFEAFEFVNLTGIVITGGLRRRIVVGSV